MSAASRPSWLPAITAFLSFATLCLAATVKVTLPATVPTYNVIQDNFLGLSVEFNVLDRLIGPSPDNIPEPIKNYLKNLRSRSSSPYRLRIGGNSLDGSFYDPTAKQMISFNLASTNSGIDRVPVTYGPQVLTTLYQLGTEVGGISHLIGLSMATPSNNTNVVQFAQQAEKTLGSTLDALLAGNEPDEYIKDRRRPPSYVPANYSVELNKVNGDLRQGNVKATLGAPSTCCNRPNWDLTDVLAVITNTEVNAQLKYASLQHYPQTSCFAAGISSWDISYFTNHSNVPSLAAWQSDGILMAREDGKPVILTEFNSASCGGQPGRSDTFAAAMWTIDYALGLAVNNYTAAYIHTREPGVTYNVFSYPNATNSSSSEWQTGLQYYSLLLLSEALSNLGPSSGNGSIVVDLSSSLGAPTLMAGYAIYDGNAPKETPRALVLFNFANGTLSTTFSIPSENKKSSARVRILTAPTVNESSPTKVTYAGQTVDGMGKLNGDVIETIVQCKKGCNVEVPGPGVALVMLQSHTSDANVSSSGHRQAILWLGGQYEFIGTVFLGLLIVCVF